MRTTFSYIKNKLLSRPAHLDYITLKEAAELSGYSSDYIGQLIRAGKLHGKQVYSNVAWMTTPQHIEVYVYEQEHAKQHPPRGVRKYAEQVRQAVRRASLYGFDAGRIVLLLSLAVLMTMVLGLFYIGSVSLDRYLQERAYAQYIETQHIDETFYAPVPFRLEGTAPPGT